MLKQKVFPRSTTTTAACVQSGRVLWMRVRGTEQISLLNCSSDSVPLVSSSFASTVSALLSHPRTGLRACGSGARKREQEQENRRRNQSRRQTVRRGQERKESGSVDPRKKRGERLPGRKGEQESHQGSCARRMKSLSLSPSHAVCQVRGKGKDCRSVGRACNDSENYGRRREAGEKAVK